MNHYRKVFATKKTGRRGVLIGCPLPEWNCKDAERLRGLKLGYVPLELGSEDAHWKTIREAYSKRKPFIAYAWEPHWIHAQLDLVEVKLPEYSKEAWPASDWPEDVPFNFGSRAFVQTHPQVAKLISNMKLTNRQQAKMIYQVEVKKRNLDEVVWEWMARNEKIWRKWIPADS